MGSVVRRVQAAFGGAAADARDVASDVTDDVGDEFDFLRNSAESELRPRVAEKREELVDSMFQKFIDGYAEKLEARGEAHSWLEARSKAEQRIPRSAIERIVDRIDFEKIRQRSGKGRGAFNGLVSEPEMVKQAIEDAADAVVDEAGDLSLAEWSELVGDVAAEVVPEVLEVAALEALVLV